MKEGGSRLVHVPALVILPAVFCHIVYCQSEVSLIFPLQGLDPTTAPITSIFDHAMDPVHTYVANGVVTAYTNETGLRSTHEINSSVCYENVNGTEFMLNGHYTGRGCGGTKYLSYDGHPGYDFAAQSSIVVAAADGIVVIAQPTLYQDGKGSQCNCYGNYIVISHANGTYKTIYGHLKYGSFSSTLRNTTVVAGQPIAVTDNTGDSTGEHLHFEVQRRIGGTYYPIDPYGWQSDATDPYPYSNPSLWAPYGSETTQASLDDQPWAGAVSYSIAGPTNVIIGQAAPGTTSGLSPGEYTLTYNGGGPPGTTFSAVTPTPTQRINAAEAIIYTLGFRSLGTFTETFSTPPDYSNNWIIAYKSGLETVTYTMGNFRIQAPAICTGPSSGTGIAFRSKQSFIGDIDVSFQLNHGGYGRTSVYLWSGNLNQLVMGADLDTNDTNYLNFTSGPNSTQYLYSSTPYLNKWITLRIQVVENKVNFYADNGSGQQLLQTFPVPVSSPPDTYTIVFSAGSVCWKSGPNDTSFRQISATGTFH